MSSFEFLLQPDMPFMDFLSVPECLIIRQISYCFAYLCPRLQQPDVCSKRSRGSLFPSTIQRQWKLYFTEHGIRRLCPAILDLVAPIDRDETSRLFLTLGQATKIGSLASDEGQTNHGFQHSGSRSGYFQTKFNRVANLPYLLLLREMQALRLDVLSRTASNAPTERKVASIGGGPGYDALGLSLLRDFCRSSVKFHVTIYDYEEGWRDIVEAGHAQISDRMDFERVDITQSLTHAVNGVLAKSIDECRLYLFFFVCVENTQALQEQRFRFFRQLWTRAPVSSWFVFTDSTHRLWPAFWTLCQELMRLEDGNEMIRFHVYTPFTRSSHNALVVKKVTTKEYRPQENAPAILKLQEFQHHQDQHRY